MTTRRVIQLPQSMAGVQCEQDLMGDIPPSPDTVIDLKNLYHKASCSPASDDDMVIGSPMTPVVVDDEKDQSIDIKSTQQYKGCCEIPKSHIKVFDNGEAAHDSQALLAVSDNKYDVKKLIDNLPVQQPKCEDLHADKHPEKVFCSKVKCIDETTAEDKETPWQICADGPIIQGSEDSVKEFASALPTYWEGVKVAEKVGISSPAGLVVAGQGTRVTDVKLGTDGVRGVHLFSSTFDASSLTAEASLGGGQFGCVISCRHHQSGATFAVKRVALEKFNPNEAVVLAMATSQQHQLGSKYLASGFGFYLDGTSIHIVMEQVYKTLERFMFEKQGNIETETVKSIAKQGLEGLQFLSSNGYVHLDIKPQNVGLTRSNEVKLLDFGSCSRVGSANAEAGMTPKYVAREVAYPLIQKKQPQCTPKADTYSYGVCLISLMRGSHVWDQVSFEPNKKDSCIQANKKDPRIQAMEYIFTNEEELHKQIPTNISEQLRDLILRLTCYDCKKRWTAQDALQHPFFTSQGFAIGSFWNFNIGNQNVLMEQLIPQYVNNMPVVPQQDLWCIPPTEKKLKPPLPEAKVMNPTEWNFQNLNVQEFQHLNIRVPQNIQVPQTSVTATTTIASNHGNDLPVMLQDEGMSVQELAPPEVEVLGVDSPVPVFDKIMTNKMKRHLPMEEEEEVAISLRCNENKQSALQVPEFGDLLTDNNDYTKERQPKKQPKLASRQGTDQFEFGGPADFVDLKRNRATACGRRTLKKTRAVGPYEPHPRKGGVSR